MAPSTLTRVVRPQVAAAATSPLAILLAGAGASVGVLAGLGPAAVVGLGAAAWGARVAAAAARTRTPEPPALDPRQLSTPWRAYLEDAVASQGRYRAAVERTPAGPLRDRLVTIGARIDDAVEECWRVARHGHTLQEARSSIDEVAVAAELEALAARAEEPWAAGSHLPRTVEALQAQLDAARRLADTVADAEARLRLLDARMDETVARAIELSVQAQDPAELGALSDEVEGVVGDLEALRAGLAAADRSSGAPPAGP